MSDKPLAVPLDGLHFDDKLYFVEEPVEIVDREVKRLKQSRIPLVKVQWNSKRGPEFTWEREDQFRKKYPHLFARTAPSSTSPRNTASDSKTESDLSKDPFEDHSAPIAISPFHDDPYIKVMQAYNATSNEYPILLPQAPIAPPTILHPSSVLPPSPLFVS
nr:putative reverse transcriptase domain-containing protein [Tanacetum cinerariifolium]